jgi:hypothetical protein
MTASLPAKGMDLAGELTGIEEVVVLKLLPRMFLAVAADGFVFGKTLRDNRVASKETGLPMKRGPFLALSRRD